LCVRVDFWGAKRDYANVGGLLNVMEM
jgi:hypothetical protein